MTLLGIPLEQIVVLVVVGLSTAVIGSFVFDYLERRFKKTVMLIKPDQPTVEKERWI